MLFAYISISSESSTMLEVQNTQQIFAETNAFPYPALQTSLLSVFRLNDVVSNALPFRHFADSRIEIGLSELAIMKTTL